MSLDLNAIAKRAKAATAGPWSVGQRWEDEDQAMANWLPINHPAIDPESPHQPERVALIRYYPGGFQFPHAEARADAEFIAHAREDVPALLAALAAVEQDRDKLSDELAKATAEFGQAQSVLNAARDVVKVWREWRAGRGKQVIPIKALALAVDVHALAPVAAALTERECPGLPTTRGVPDDGMHCDHWYDGGPCCRCNAPAEPSGTEAAA